MSDFEEKARNHLPLTEATYYILVSLIEPRHGYGIMQNVAVISGNTVKMGPGTLYGALTKFVEQKLIERIGEQETEGERRKTYGLTRLGKRVVILESERLAGLAKIGRLAVETIGKIRPEE